MSGTKIFKDKRSPDEIELHDCCQGAGAGAWPIGQFSNYASERDQDDPAQVSGDLTQQATSSFT